MPDVNSDSHTTEKFTKINKFINWFNVKDVSESDEITPNPVEIENPSISENIKREILITKIVNPLEEILNKISTEAIKGNSYINKSYGLYGIKIDITGYNSQNFAFSFSINKAPATSTSSLLTEDEVHKTEDVLLVDASKTSDKFVISNIKLSSLNTVQEIFSATNNFNNFDDQLIQKIQRLFIENNPNAEMLNEYSILIDIQQAEIAQKSDTSSKIAQIKSLAQTSGVDIEDIYFSNISAKGESNLHSQVEYYQLVERQIKSDLELIEWTTEFMEIKNGNASYTDLINQIQQNSKIIITNSSNQKLDESTIHLYQTLIDQVFKLMGIKYEDAKYLKNFINDINLENITIRDLTNIINLELHIAYFGEDVLRELSSPEHLDNLTQVSTINTFANQFANMEVSDKEDERYILLQSINTIYKQILENGSVKFLDRFKYKTEKLRLLRYLRINKEYKEVWM